MDENLNDFETNKKPPTEAVDEKKDYINKITNTLKGYLKRVENMENENANINLNANVGEDVQTTKKVFDFKKLIPIIIAIILVLGISKACDGFSGGTFGGVSDDMYIGVAEQIIAKSLKKPSSLEVIDAYIYEKDDYGSAIVCMDITSENGFGGADRDTVYVCVMHLESDGSYQFHPTWNYTENVTNLDMLKSINGFGEPKE